jgi:hypothetical protein
MIRRSLAALALLICSACATPAATLTPGPGSAEPTMTTPASPSAAASPSEAPSPSAPVTRLAFQLAASIERAELVTIADVGTGYLVGGCRLDPSGECQGALVLRSTDGRAWTEVALPDAAGKRVVRVARTPLGLMALGVTVVSEPPAQRAAWRSSDGILWEALSIDAPETIVFETVASLPDRTVFFGADYAFEFAVEDIAYATADGTSWTSGSAPFVTKVAADPGVVAVGDPCIDICTGETTHAYRSVDGFTWTEDPLPDAMVPTGVTATAAWDGHAIVGGMTQLGGPLGATLWLDGATGWSPIPLERGAAISVQAILVTPDGLAVLGTGGGEGYQGWWSADGRTFRSVAVEGLGDVFIAGSAGSAETLLLVDDREVWLLRR